MPSRIAAAPEPSHGAARKPVFGSADVDALADAALVPGAGVAVGADVVVVVVWVVVVWVVVVVVVVVALGAVTATSVASSSS